jgi:hypothetical protein
MSADGNPPKAVPPFPISLLRSCRTCALCALPIGESQFCVGLKSGGRLHLDCYLSNAYHSTPARDPSQ